MSACKTGCGADVGNANLCTPCANRWDASGEARRVRSMSGDHLLSRVDVAVVDFCNRIRAERQSGRLDASR